MASASHPSFDARQAEVIAHATVALDGQDNAMRWLQKQHPALNGQKPLDVLAQGESDQIQRVDDLLSALEYGIFV